MAVGSGISGLLLLATGKHAIQIKPLSHLFESFGHFYIHIFVRIITNMSY